MGTGPRMSPRMCATPDSLRRLMAETTERFGRIDIVVANAGITRNGGVARLPAADWRAVMNTDVDGVFHTVQAALPHLEAGGSILTSPRQWPPGRCPGRVRMPRPRPPSSLAVLAVGLTALLWPAGRRPGWLTLRVRTAVPAVVSLALTVGVASTGHGRLFGPGENAILLCLTFLTVRRLPRRQAMRGAGRRYGPSGSRR